MNQTTGKQWLGISSEKNSGKTGHPLLSANIYNRRKGLTHRQHPVVRTPSGPDPFEHRRKEPFFPSQEIYGCPFIFLSFYFPSQSRNLWVSFYSLFFPVKKFMAVLLFSFPVKKFMGVLLFLSFPVKKFMGVLLFLFLLFLLFLPFISSFIFLGCPFIFQKFVGILLFPSFYFFCIIAGVLLFLLLFFPFIFVPERIN